jgi:hypothetical protein
MQRTTRTTSITIPLDNGAGQHIMAQNFIELLDNDVPTFSTHTMLPMVAEDFTADVLVAINAKLAPLGLNLSKVI